jgi:hypothetical protein
MQREKLYNLHKTTYFVVPPFVFKISKLLRDQILGIAKIDRTAFFFFLKTITITFTVTIAELFALHPVVYFIFLLIKHFLDETMK